MPKAPRRFDADARAKERESAEIVIGETVWHPARRTNHVTGQVAALAQQAEDMLKQIREAKRDATAEEGQELTRLLYAQIRHMLVDDARVSPSDDFLLEYLDEADALGLLQFLQGQDQTQILTDALERTQAAALEVLDKQSPNASELLDVVKRIGELAATALEEEPEEEERPTQASTPTSPASTEQNGSGAESSAGASSSESDSASSASATAAPADPSPATTETPT